MVKLRIFISGSKQPRYSMGGVFKLLICIQTHINSWDWMHLLIHSVCTHRMPPKVSSKGAKKATSKAKATSTRDKKSKRKRRRESYSIYIYKVLKQVHPDIGVSSEVMSKLNSFLNDMFQHIAGEASHLAHYNRPSTITSKEIQTAVRLLLPTELAKHTVSKAAMAVTKYTGQSKY